MSEIAIKVENVSKKYKLLHKQQEASDSFVGNLTRSIKTSFKGHGHETTEEFWALKDISFEIKRGDRVGIIGRNGAGKSTLLKVLSRIVKPSFGRIEYTGKMASLLEVGTGFHGDLSGRENIYLNGSILGMSKREIDSKFDEIVAFSEIEQFLDTPVKKYSSGMYVRLAFAVAAHLDPDILIVDEVLAVGDAAFQKKCLGMMENVSQKEGKTILFVSHNMGQIASLCNKGILLSKGLVENQGDAKDIINLYFNAGGANKNNALTYDDNDKKEYVIKGIALLNSKRELTNNFAHNESIVVELEIQQNKYLNDVLMGVQFYDVYDKRIFTSQIIVSDKFENAKTRKFYLQVPPNTLIPNNFHFSLGIHIPNIQLIDEKQHVCAFTVYDNGSEFYKYNNSDIGLVFVNCKWNY